MCGGHAIETEEQKSNDTSGARGRPRSEYVRWGGLGAILGPLLVLAANGYLFWAERTYAGPVYVEAGTTTLYLVFQGFRLLGALLLVFGLVALYTVQLEATGRLGVVGFTISMVGTVLLTAVAWFSVFVVPVMAAEVPAFVEGVLNGEFGTLMAAGAGFPILVQAIGWMIFGVATYRADVFPRRAAVVLVVGALLLFVPVTGIPVVFQLAVASLGYLLFTGRVASATPADVAALSGSDSPGG